HGGALVMDIGAAQRLLGRQDRVDRILIKVPGNVADWQKKLAQNLPEGVSLAASGSGTEENRKMLSAFRWNLKLLSYVALIVGAFLIFNTISVSVVRRRPEIGIVRALGASRSGVLLGYLGEALCFGIAGALLGILLGRLMAIGAVRLLGATVAGLYVSSRPAPIELTAPTVLLAFVVGIGVALASAASPAREE